MPVPPTIPDKTNNTHIRLLRGVYSDTTQLNSTSSWVASANSDVNATKLNWTRRRVVDTLTAWLSPINERSDPVDSVCRSWRYIWRVLTSLPGDISTNSFSDRLIKATAIENISQEMNVAGWYITHHNAALGSWEQKHDWPASRWLAVRCSTGSVALPIVGDRWVASVRLRRNSTQLDVELSWVAFK